MDMNQWATTDLPADYDLPISAIMTTHAWSANIDDSLAAIEEMLAKRKISSVPILDSKGAIFGVLSWRDLLRCRVSKTNLAAVQAWELCIFKPLIVSPNTAIHEVAKLMLEEKVSDAVVMEHGMIKGFVSTFDFVQRLLNRE
jgi:predicted transcriptional regulator